MNSSSVSAMATPKSMSAGVVVWWLACIAAALVLVFPLTLVDMPPLEDYPLHLARAYVHAFGANDPFLSRMYASSWHIIPNLVIDLIMPPMLHVMPLRLASFIVIGLMLLVPFSGIIALHRATFGRRSWWPLAGALGACNGLFLMGFVNFIIGIGVALLVAAYWSAQRSRRPVLATAGLALGAVATFFCHILPLAFLGLIVASTMAEDAWSAYRSGHGVARLLLRDAAVLCIGFGATVLLYFSSELSEAAGPPEYTTLRGKMAHLFVAFLNYDFALDAVTVMAVLSVPAIGLLRSGPIDPGVTPLPLRSILSISVLLLLYFVAPWRIGGGAWVDLRFALMATFVLFAGVDPMLPRRWAIAAAVGLTALFVVRMSVVAFVWNEHKVELADVRRAIAAVPVGARVLIVQVDPVTNPEWWASLPHSHHVEILGSTDDYLSALLITERQAFWPLMYAIPSQQPLVLLPPYDSIAETTDPPDYRMLADPRPDLSAFPFLRDWQHHYDFVFLMNPSGSSGYEKFLPESLVIVASTPNALIWRIKEPVIQE